MPLSIEGVISAKLGLVSHQNSVPLLRELIVSNPGQEQWEHLVLELKPSVPFAADKRWTIDRLNPESVLPIRDLDIELKQGYLSGLSESMQGSVLVRLCSSDGEVLVEKQFAVELLAPNEWGGANSMPELLAAFCTPNDPAVDKIVKSMSDALRRAGLRDAIDGYDSGARKRVWEMASALWSAVCGYEISYALPPASFEKQGQKIRTPSQVLRGGVATCIDTALLFAAASEQAGLNPVIVMTEGHAFAGIWLQPQEFAQILNEDVSSLRKRIELQELIVFETTLATQAAAPRFSQAIDNARRQLQISEDDFFMALDVRRARMQRLRPLAIMRHQGNDDESANADELKVSSGVEAAPELPGFDISIEEKPTTPAGKLEQWQRKLLDLTSRNRMLHVGKSASVIELRCPDAAALEDMLAAGKGVRIVPMPDLDVGGRSSELYAQRHQQSLEEEVARQAMTRNEIVSCLEQHQLDKRLVDLFRKARSDLQEGGSNTLFLAVGFLRWKKSANDSRSYQAPLILIPVSLERRSVVSGITMKMLDDEPRFNLTLLELLRHDFGVSIPTLDGALPTDASGIDVDAIWNLVRSVVRDIPGFEVVAKVVLGTFSFAKYLMWRDLVDRAEQLQQNEVVHHLLNYKSGESALTQSEEFPTPEKLDDEIDPAELFLPLPADSSQVSAVVASAKGHSFVLDGPPGTGKSQTIANMIAHNLAIGKRVLFVAEKMAALDVVKRRLDDKGIGQFCLELHSSKSSKMHVLEQLDRAWESRATISQATWNARAREVRLLRDRLNGLVRVLHHPHPCGWSIYVAIGRVIKDATPMTPQFEWPSSVVHDAQQMEHMRDVVRRLDLNRQAIESLGAQLGLVANTEWSNSWQSSLVVASRQLLTALSACDEARTQIAQATGFTLEENSPTTAVLLDFLRILPKAYEVDLRFAFSPTFNRTQQSVAQVRQLLDEYRSLEQGLSQRYGAEAIRRIDTAELRREWTEAAGKFMFLSTMAKKKLAKALAEKASISEPPDVEADLPVLEAMKQKVTALDALSSDMKEVPGWNGLASDDRQIASAIDLAQQLRAGVTGLADTPDHVMTLKQQLQRLVVEGNDLLAPEGSISTSIRQLGDRHKGLQTALNTFTGLAGTDVNLATDKQALQQCAQAIIDQQNLLNGWCSWLRVRNEANASGLQPIVEAVEQNTLPEGSVAENFEVAYARWFAIHAIDAEPLLRHFVPAEHQSDIDAYTVATDQLADLTSTYIRAKLSGGIPDKNGVTQRSGFGILKHELQKQRRHKPVRQLAQEMGQDFSVLAPCMLMSPLSIAQYLPANYDLFDIVIFDEASQIAPWDAIGAIARGKQVVVAGDPRQMPPTSFFNRAANDDEDDTDADLESILDECLGAGMRQHGLSWHYRSRHESLITFSNFQYYGGSLVTFPAADTRPSAVSWKRVDGVYARGTGGRHNQVEAKAIVAEVVKRLTDPHFIASGKSIGVITLNSDQQSLIDNLLDRARQEHPEIETFFDEERAEPVIVKNLETMQGDERDLIILGIAYGPTEPGASTMSMNFGPLNREGGERRLNVAVTRARQEMMVFTSFEPSMIDLNRTSAKAVHDLRHFIEFADKGPQAIAAAVHGSVGSYDSPFEQYVAEGLRAKGWKTHPQVGVSRFRIDLGVVHPDRPGDYLAGVECDGATYHSGATARDRDKVRSEILRKLGWTLFRVWSTEFWINRRGALERLHQQLSDELEHQRSIAARLQQEEEQRAQKAREAAKEEGLAILERDAGHTGDESEGEMSSECSASNDENADEVDPCSRLVAGVASSTQATSSSAYRMADLSELADSLNPEIFHEAEYDTTLAKCIRAVLEQEAPILDKSLVDRVARAHGFKRSGRLIRERVLDMAERFHHLDYDSQHGDFVWLRKEDIDQWRGFRVPMSADNNRSIDEISPQEISAASMEVSGEDQEGQIARLFGIRRLTSSARNRIRQLLDVESKE
ncbi:hypothetical protein R84981_001774 [Carnimonas sp. R-84981]|uniref:DUF3320 domain-containing protein n=1 Tax=Carnimonas bestiolae TaxID=3402172 RepID=UPI003EDBDD14